jgi:hypothetical protein
LLKRIISGGQTGADRAALDAALDAGFPCGGWCPRGRRAEDGPLPARYPLRELDSPNYRDRTHRNVLDSDATAIIAFGPLTGGSALTRDFAEQAGKPVLVIDADAHTADEAAERLHVFVEDNSVETLNAAGPRASGQPDIYAFVYGVVGKVLAAAG